MTFAEDDQSPDVAYTLRLNPRTANLDCFPTAVRNLIRRYVQRAKQPENPPVERSGLQADLFSHKARQEGD